MIDLVITIVVIAIIVGVALFFVAKSRKGSGPGGPTLNDFQMRQKAEIERLQSRGEYLTPDQVAGRAQGGPA